MSILSIVFKKLREGGGSLNRVKCLAKRFNCIFHLTLFNKYGEKSTEFWTDIPSPGTNYGLFSIRF